jgi:hypothetical protein
MVPRLDFIYRYRYLYRVGNYNSFDSTIYYAIIITNYSIIIIKGIIIFIIHIHNIFLLDILFYSSFCFINSNTATLFCIRYFTFFFLTTFAGSFFYLFN